MFDYLEAEAYRELRREIHSIVNEALKDTKLYDSDYSGKMSAFAEVLKCMISVDNDLHEKIVREAEREAAYYSNEKH